MIPLSESEFGLCLDFSRICVAAWVLISATEWFAARHVFRDDGLLTWKVMKIREGAFFATSLARTLFAEPSVGFVLSTRIVAGLILLVVGGTPAIIGALGVALLSSFYMSFRASVGGDGSDQMGVLLIIGLLLMNVGALFHDQSIAFSGALLLGGQATLSYFVAGFSKLISPTWRSGAAIVGVMGTESYGHDFAALVVVRTRTAALAVCWAVILTEVAFPLILVVPMPLVYGGLCTAAFFHVSNAYFMGLNTFVPSFIGTYPGVIILNLVVRHGLNLI
jgi:hypothetical protein